MDKFDSEKSVEKFNQERKFFEPVKQHEASEHLNKTYDSVLYRSLPAVKLGKNINKVDQNKLYMSCYVL